MRIALPRFAATTTLIASVVLLSGAARAETTGECDPSGGACPTGLIGTDTICQARLAGLVADLNALGRRMCDATRPSSTSRAEKKMAKDFGDALADCPEEITGSDSVAVGRYLYDWLKNGKVDGYGDSQTVNGTSLPVSLRPLHEAIRSTWKLDELAAEGLPAFYREEALFAETVTALKRGAADVLQTPDSTAPLRDATRRVDAYKRLSGLAGDHPRIRFLSEILGRLETPTQDPLTGDVADGFATHAPVRLDGEAGWATAACDPAAARDDAIADGVALMWATHLRGHGGKDNAMLDSAVGAALAQMEQPARAEPAFSGALTGAWVAGYLRDTYFPGFRVPKIPASLTTSVAARMSTEIAARWDLPTLPVTEGNPGDALAVAAKRFDNNNNLRVLLDDRCDLNAVRHVAADGSAGVPLAGEGWDARGIYTADSFQHDEQVPVSELVFKEEDGVNPDSARRYEVELACEEGYRTFRLTIPPTPKLDAPINFVDRQIAPPYEDMLADGQLNGVVVSGHHTRDGDVVIRAYEHMGFKVVFRDDDVALQDRMFERLAEKDPETGEPVADYFIKNAHANGYAYDAGMFRINKRGVETVLEKKSPDGRVHRIVVLGNKQGEGEETEDGYEKVSYARYFDAMDSRGDATMFVGNFSCWSASKSAYEMDGIRSEHVHYLPTDKASSFWLGYWRGLSKEEVGFALTRALDDRLTYEEMADKYPRMEDECLLPSDAAFSETMTNYVRNHRAGERGLPIRIALAEAGATA